MPTRRSRVTPNYGWDTRALRYRNLTTGRFVSALTLRGAIDETIATSERSLMAIGQQLLDGQISLMQWRDAVANELRLLHTAAGASAMGGWANMSQADWGFVGQLLRTQYTYLNNFGLEIATGQQPLDGTFMVRLHLYAQAARGTYEQMLRRAHLLRGYREERRVLGVADHCPTCLEQAALDWQPIGTLNRIGDSECITNCRCHFEYR